MADKAPAPKRVAVITADGQFGTVEEHEAGLIEQSGGRVLTKAQALQAQQRADYEAKGTGEKLVGGAVATAAGPIVGNALAGTGVIADSPEAQAFSQGMSSAATGGLDQVAVKKALEFTAGKAAADAYGKHQLEIAKANEGYKTAGEVTGFAAMALGGGGKGLSRALPGGAISAIGTGLEQAASSALGGLASRGVLGRALATGGELAARGMAEGALYSTANEYTEEMLGDTGLNGDKLFAAFGHGALMGGAGGAALGATGSLAKSAVGGVVGAARGGLSRVMGRAEQAAADAGAKADTAIAEGRQLVQSAESKAQAAATQEAAGAAKEAAASAKTAARAVEERPMGIADALRAPDDAARRLSNEFAVDALNATKGQVKNAVEFVKGGKAAVGEYVNRIALKPAAGDAGMLGSSVRAGMAGRADDLLGTIQGDIAGRIKTGFDEALGGTGARVKFADLDSLITGRANKMRATATQAAGADAFETRIRTELDSLIAAGKVGADGTVDATDLFFTNASLRRNAYEVARQNSSAGEAYRGFLKDLDDHIVSKIDDAAKVAGEGGRGDSIRYWKREYQLAKAAEEMAEHGTERIRNNNMFGLRVGAAGLTGLATGNPLLGAATLVGGKIATERGMAAAATLLGKVADLGYASKVIRGVDESIGRAAKGITVAPRKGALPERPPVDFRARAAEAMRRVSEAQADPATYVDKVTRNTEAMGTTAPMLAGALTQKATDYLAFMSAKLPSAPPPNPLDPHPMPVLTDQQARKVALYDWYWERPGRFFDELEHGKMTFEGLEVAKAAMPGAFQELQMRTAEGLATLASLGKKPPYQQRQNLGALLDFPATASQRPEHAAFLQKNAASMVDANKPPPAPKGSTKHTTQRSALDRLESDGVGRR